MLGEDCESIEASYTGNRARNGARRQAFVHHAVNEALQIVAVEPLNGLFDGGSECSEPLQIPAVTFQGVIGKASFDAQMREIRVYEIMGG